MIRVFVVDDSTFVRKAIVKVLHRDPELRVVGEAASGAEALRTIAARESRRGHARSGDAGARWTAGAPWTARAGGATCRC